MASVTKFLILGELAAMCIAAEFAVVMPYWKGDLARLNYKLRFQPPPCVSSGDMEHPVDLIFFNTAPEDMDINTQKKHFIQSMGEYTNCFENIYIRYSNHSDGGRNENAGRFFCTLILNSTGESILDKYTYFMIQESDCVPIRTDWLKRLVELIHCSNTFYVMGSSSALRTNIDGQSHHINGNAIYMGPKHADFPEFRRVLQTVEKWTGYDSQLYVALKQHISLHEFQVRYIWSEHILDVGSGNVHHRKRLTVDLFEQYAETYVMHGLEFNHLMMNISTAYTYQLQLQEKHNWKRTSKRPLW